MTNNFNGDTGVCRADVRRFAYAHHSYSAYETTTTVSVEGTVEKILFVNPHVTVIIKAKDVEYRPSSCDEVDAAELVYRLHITCWRCCGGQRKPDERSRRPPYFSDEGNPPALDGWSGQASGGHNRRRGLVS
jgi:hypothetical protein